MVPSSARFTATYILLVKPRVATLGIYAQIQELNPKFGREIIKNIDIFCEQGLPTRRIHLYLPGCPLDIS